MTADSVMEEWSFQPNSCTRLYLKELWHWQKLMEEHPTRKRNAVKEGFLNQLWGRRFSTIFDPLQISQTIHRYRHWPRLLDMEIWTNQSLQRRPSMRYATDLGIWIRKSLYQQLCLKDHHFSLQRSHKELWIDLGFPTILWLIMSDFHTQWVANQKILRLNGLTSNVLQLVGSCIFQQTN